MEPLTPAETLTFDFERPYDLVANHRPLTLVNFRNEDPTSHRLIGFVRVACLVDSGADVTLLPAAMAVPLGIDLSTLPRRPMMGVGGRAYGTGAQQLRAEICGKWVPVPVSFMAPELRHTAILGRAGAFDAMNIVFMHSARRMLATPV